jgi:toxin ParE1/3/4
MAHYDLTHKALEDLNHIWSYTYDEWIENQADQYYSELLDGCRLLAEHPNFGKNYEDIEDQLFGYLVNKHLIFYQKINKEEILIVRILHSSMGLKRKIIA